MLDSVPSLTRLIAELGRLPGVGRKTATRLAFFILQQPEGETQALARALADVKQRVMFCSQCYHVTETDPCLFCRAPDRDEALLCVVEQPQDLLAIERGGGFHGRYHVLHGALSPLDGIGPDALRIPQLIERVKRTGIREVLVATNFTMEGEATALYLSRLLRDFPVRVTRLAHGIPMGGDLEYLDSQTLSGALARRYEIES
ncbi:MAG: recombination protein RecR [Desulfuromonadaceae bacterium]|nr:recombination protein RecR [Desulfuromonadaceae bacterium]